MLAESGRAAEESGCAAEIQLSATSTRWTTVAVCFSGAECGWRLS